MNLPNGPVSRAEFEQAVIDLRLEIEAAKYGPRVYNVSQVAERLSLSKTRVNELIRNGELRSFKIGGARRVDPADLRDFIEGRRKWPAPTPDPVKAVKPHREAFSPEFLERLYGD